MNLGDPARAAASRFAGLVSVENLRTAVREPAAVVAALRGVRATYRYNRLDTDEEDRQRAARLTGIVDRPRERLAAFEAEIRTDREFQAEVGRRRDELRAAGCGQGTSPAVDGRTLYVLCRALRPSTVVETGVLHGCFDAYVLCALAENGEGTLHSIDLPEQPGDFEHGYLVPPTLRDRWELHLGDARELLPDLLADLGDIDLFVHDSLHEPDHMTFEYGHAYPRLSPGGVLASHDVLRNDAFQRFSTARGMPWCRVANLGLARKPRR